MKRMTIAEVRALAMRSGFEIVKWDSGLYNIYDAETGIKLLNKNGSPHHKNADELYESLTERS
jgi:hypothetical protein